MKTNFTLLMCRAFIIMSVVAFSSKNLVAQSTFNVSVTSNVYTPSTITIAVGDKVSWKNNGGFHNVNGTKATFPANPEGFGNNLGSGWTYEYVFNTAGTYDYHCDPHAGLGMVGKVIVNPKTVTGTIAMNDINAVIHLYPNPATNSITVMVPSGYSSIQSFKIYSITGSLIDQKQITGSDERISYDISQLRNGIYFIEINTDIQKDVLKFLKQ